MSHLRERSAIGVRPAPSVATAWVKHGEGAAPVYSARLTIDVTSALRGRIKVAAYQSGVTAAALLRAVLEREFPEHTP